MKTALLLALAVLLFADEACAAVQLSLKGYYKNHSAAIDQPEIRGAPADPRTSIMGISNNRLRLNLTGKLNPDFTLIIAYDFSPRIQDHRLFSQSPFGFFLNLLSYRAADLRSRLYPSSDSDLHSFAIYQNLDRAYITVETKSADILIGRQPIAWGSARVINPTDVIAPFSFDEIDVEDRRGVDAVRVRIPLGQLQEMDAGYVFGDHFKYYNSAAFARLKLYYRQTDVTLSAIRFSHNLLVGLDLTRSLGGAGVWAECAYVMANRVSPQPSLDHDNYFRSSIGADYSLRDGTYLFLEYHFNQAGATSAGSYLEQLNSVAYQQGSVYLLGRHYLAPGFTHQITPLITLSGEILFNVSDPSAFLLPQLEYNIAENVYLSAGAYVGLGERPEYLMSFTGPAIIRMRSEFGSYANSYFAFARYYF